MDCSMPGFPVLHCLPESARSRPLTWWYYPIISFSAVPSPPALSLSRMYMFNFREREVAQSCPTLCDPMGCSLPGSSVRGIIQARVLEWVAVSFSRRSSQSRDRTWVSRVAGRRFTIWATKYCQTLFRSVCTNSDLPLGMHESSMCSMVLILPDMESGSQLSWYQGPDHLLCIRNYTKCCRE